MYCMADSDCRATLTCINECQLYQPRSKQAMCAYICEMTDGKIWKNKISAKGNLYQNNINRNRSVPNLSAIKNDYVRDAYKQVRSVNPSQRGNSYSRTSRYDNIGSANRTQFNNSSTRSRPNSYSGSSSRSSQGFSSGSASRGGSRGSSPGARGGSRKIN